jgi:hypothetical protein
VSFESFFALEIKEKRRITYHNVFTAIEILLLTLTLSLYMYLCKRKKALVPFYISFIIAG